MTDEEIMIRDILSDPIEVEDDELDNDYQSGPDHDDSFNYDFHEPCPNSNGRSIVKTEIEDYYE